MTDEGDRDRGKVADSFEAASAGSLVYVDERGQVRSPAQYRRASIASLSVTAVTWGAMNWLLWQLAGPPGLVVGATMTVLSSRALFAWYRLRRAISLMAAGRIDDAEPIYRRLAYGRSVSAATRSRALQDLGRIATLRGRYPDALALLEAGLAASTGDEQPSRWQQRVAEYSIVITLVNVDRVQDARRRFDAIKRTLEGDFLRVSRATAELYLAFGEEQTQFASPQLREQAEIALALPSSLPLLLLVAWAYGRSGDREAEARLLAAAATRKGWDLLRPFFPRLAAWHESVTAGRQR